jgi:predicted alternative tryptophan synthase beta-subunit
MGRVRPKQYTAPALPPPNPPPLSKRQETTMTTRDETETAQAATNTIEQETRDESYRNISQEVQFFASISPEFKKRADDLMKRINKVSIRITKEEMKAETIQEIDNRKCNDALVLSAAKTDMPDIYEMIRGVAFRDCFPQKYRDEGHC